MIRTRTVVALPVDLDNAVAAAADQLLEQGHSVTQISQPVATPAHPTKLIVMLVYRPKDGGQ